MNRKITIDLFNDEGEIKETLLLKNKVYKDYGYYTEWETEEYPFIKIVHDEDHYYTTSKEIEVKAGNFSEEDLEIIAIHFNGYIDTFLNRPVLVNVRILREEDDIPFQHGLINVESYRYDGNKFVLTGSQKTLMNNYNGYVQVSHLVDKKLNDRFLKISELEIRLNIPKYHNREEETYIEHVEYIDSNGIVIANSNRDNCPYVDIKVADINKKLIEGLDLKGKLFIGEII